MVIKFLRPYALLLIPVLILFTIYTSKQLKKMYSFRKRLILLLRNTMLILLVLSISGLNISWNARNTTTILAVDLSDSMKEYREQAENIIKKAVDEKPGRDLMGIVAFGDNCEIEAFTAKNTLFSKFTADVTGWGTNIENALTSSISLFPGNTRKRIVLITDGEENSGSSLKISSSIIENGIDLKILKVERDLKNEAAVESVSVPQTLNMGEEFSVVVNVKSKVKTGAKLILFNGRERAYEKTIELQSGSNKFVFKDTAASGGFRNYRAVIEPDVDTISQNNEASAFTNIKDRPKVLVIQDSDGEADEIVKMLKSSGIEYKLINAFSAPTTLSDISAYKTIITCNVSAENLSDVFLNSLEIYVRDFGGGVIATGGENSFALGGYYKTSLEKVLPVNMELKGKKEIPDMAMMLIIDKSGSMGEGTGGLAKVDIAKEAAARVLDSLRPNKDDIGVLAFDDTVYKVVQRKKVDDPQKIRTDIGTIRAGGGTSILPALDEGYKELIQSSAKIKHIILLTDGKAEKDGYNELIEKIKKSSITVSTVAVGSSSDRGLLENIAKQAGGRYYFTDEFTNIPKIFAKETFMAAKAYLNNRTFTPIIAEKHMILSGVAEGGLPELLGYIGAAPKSTARIILCSDEDDPILTVWQYGLGKTVAWNSDVSGRWSARYISWEKNMKLWQNITNWTIENYGDENTFVEASSGGGKGTITFTNKEETEELETYATIVNPDMESREVKLFPTAPGKYSTEFDIKETGAYMVNVRQIKDEETVRAAGTGLPIQYSPEYRIDTDSTLLDRLAQETGAKYIKSPEEIFKGNIKDASGRSDLTQLLLILTLILFMMDIALRRLNLPLQKVEEAAANLIRNTKRKGKKPIMKAIIDSEKKDASLQPEGKTVTLKKPEKDKKASAVKENLNVGTLLKNKENKYK